MTDRKPSGNSNDPLTDCALCPRECHVDRTSDVLGYCNTSDKFSIGSVCAHRGEEPVISGTQGICNIFFTHCNLQCVYCQNHDISRTDADLSGVTPPGDLLKRITDLLETGITGVGFVSPSHCLPQMKAIMDGLKKLGRNPVYVYNTNSYDFAETIRSLAGKIDVYLPDLKYLSNDLAADYSDCPDYAEVATAALKEMYRQKGAEIELDENGVIRSGLIVRHLILPGHVDNSRAVLNFIAEELSPDVHISLMSQYYPTPAVQDHPKLGRYLTAQEYQAVVDEFEKLGFWRGWVQELGSSQHYRPDFDKNHPFED